MTEARCRTIDTVVLVIGGGVAGCMAAIPALEAGLDVTVCEKGKVLDHCGSVGCGVDHYLTIMESGPEWDTPEFLLKHVPELTDGIVDMAVTSRVIHEMPRVLRKIESFGVNFKDPRFNDYYRLRSFGLPGTYHINFDGTDFKKQIGQRVRKLKGAVLTRTMAVQILTEDNQVYGALAFNFRTGEWIAIRARSSWPPVKSIVSLSTRPALLSIAGTRRITRATPRLWVIERAPCSPIWSSSKPR